MKPPTVSPVDCEHRPILLIMIRRAGGYPPGGLWLLMLCLFGILMTGCRGPNSTVTTSVVGGAPTKAMGTVDGVVSAGRPRISVEKEVCDLGEIGIDTKHTGQFKFTNAGAAPLKIVTVKTCCGVATKGVQAGQEYAPGQGGALEFECLAPSIPNPTMARILYLQTNDPVQDTVKLTIKASVVRRVDWSPKSLKLVQRRPNADCPDIVLTSLDHKPFSITGFQATSGVITVPFDPVVKATEFVLKPQVDTAKLQQNASGKISIDLTHPECTNVQLLYDTQPEFTVSPPNVLLFGLKAGRAIQQSISILSNRQGDFEIESVSSQKGTAKLLEYTKVPNGCQLRVEVTPPTPESQNTSLSDTLQVKIKNGQVLSIPFRGFYQEN